MNEASKSSSMVVTKHKNKVLCSTPEQHSPSNDSDSLCGSEAASPVPFLCTQDGAEGETDVIWNYYTPKSVHPSKSRLKNSTPLSRKSRKSTKHTIVEKPLLKRRTLRDSQKKTELFQELIELNKNLHELISKESQKQNSSEKQSESEDDIFLDSAEHSPKSGLKTNSRCLRKNLLNSKFGRAETETALESDDSINECLIKASQVIEENILKNEAPPTKKICYDARVPRNINGLKSSVNFVIDHDSMDAILNNIKLESPNLSKVKKCDSICLNNDSFDSVVGNLNDSALERLTQMPRNTPNKSNITNDSRGDTGWMIKEMVVHDGSPSKPFFGRHSSMPESPSVTDTNKPSTSGMVFGRYSSMPYGKSAQKNHVPQDSPTRCTPDEIKRKHQQAREKLLAKRLLPFTSTQTSHSLPSHESITSKPNSKFQLKVPSAKINKIPENVYTTATNNNYVQNKVQSETNINDLKSLIEKKRQEALMKLRRRQLSNKIK